MALIRTTEIWAGLLGLILAQPARAATYYVAPAGSDSNSGLTASSAFATIQRAANAVSAGDTVIVRDGVYTCPANTPDFKTTWTPSYLVELKTSGRADAWITFRSENRWGAKLDGQNTKCFQAIIFGASGDIGSFTRVEGFDVFGFASGFGLYNRLPGVHDVVIKNNRIHHLGRFCTSTPYGMGVAVGGAQFYNLTVEGNVIHDNGRLRPSEGCSVGHWNSDHGMYISSYNNVIIKNNVFYNHLAGWAIHLYSSGGSNARILNNTFAFKNPIRDGHILIGQPEKDALIANNVFYQPGNIAVNFYDASPTNVQIKNNVTDAPNLMRADYSSGAAPTYSPPGVTANANQLGVDPKLVNPPLLDFKLAAGSPAVDAGLDLSALGVTTDFDGKPRPVNGKFDAGAFEYGGAAAIANVAPARPRGLRWR